ncbi:TetR/AcrR family transcriptional regulator [Salinispora pacifica]|uniref:TetR/AcrR family transcriptional regulator n=1 Tax=Salinispora pacifica TaxID=351187 RepID=UPI000482E8B3|nr:TetR family transcriptional regulator [Salinispora pacifica]
MMPVGRPRGVDDVVILRATTHVMGQVGPAGLTLAAVARAVGLAPATLAQRFGSKHGLLLALANQTEKDINELVGRVRRTHDSALGALTTLMVRSVAALSTPESYANHLAFLCMDLGDPQLYERALTIHHTQQRMIEQLLTEAADTGELRTDSSPAALARTVQAVTAGAGLNWALEREGRLEQRLRQELDAVLAPHLPPQANPDLEES